MVTNRLASVGMTRLCWRTHMFLAPDPCHSGCDTNILGTLQPPTGTSWLTTWHCVHYTWCMAGYGVGDWESLACEVGCMGGTIGRVQAARTICPTATLLETPCGLSPVTSVWTGWQLTPAQDITKWFGTCVGNHGGLRHVVHSSIVSINQALPPVMEDFGDIRQPFIVRNDQNLSFSIGSYYFLECW